MPLAAALDDARVAVSVRLAALIWLARAESALPRGSAAAADDEADGGASAGSQRIFASRRPM